MNRLSIFALLAATFFSCQTQDIIHEEVDGVVAVEAEDFYAQEKDSLRQWIIMSDDVSVAGDSDTSHAATASGQHYLELLPDTRVTHDDELIPGVNFSNEPGQVALLHYKIHFNTPGRYYVWVRAFSAGPEDNGLHVGLDGNWPATGQRLQWCEGKHQWTWESKQRTLAVHCGVAKKIYLNIEEAGLHIVSFSMREDGFEFDKFVLSQEYKRPIEFGPLPRLK